MFIFLLILWYIIGFSSFVFWRTKSKDLNLIALILAVFAGLAGPISFFIGFILYELKHGDTGGF